MSHPPSDIVVRKATATDVPVILELIRELAVYERMADLCVATERQLRNTLFNRTPAAEVLIASTGGDPLGFALFFHNYSTFLAQRGIFLEDLFVKPEARGNGVGRALLAALARIAVDRDCGRIDWVVLDWNESAIGFYKRIGAQAMDEWTTFRVTGEPLNKLASESQGVTTIG